MHLSTRWPIHHAPANYVEMKMGYSLITVLAGVDYQTESAFIYTELLGNGTYTHRAFEEATRRI